MRQARLAGDRGFGEGGGRDGPGQVPAVGTESSQSHSSEAILDDGTDFGGGVVSGTFGRIGGTMTGVHRG